MKAERHQQDSAGRNASPSLLAIMVLCLGIAAYFLLFQRTWDSGSVLLILLLAACPLMHLFMHRGHGKH